MPKFTINNRDREMWIDNEEGLYNWWLSSRWSKRKFIKEYKDDIDAVIRKTLNMKPVS